MENAKQNSLRWQAVVAGVGGQGVLFVTRMLALGVQDLGGPVFISEVHGMAQRGGSVISHLKAGAFAAPLVPMGQAGLLLALEAGEAVRNLGFLAKGGWAVVNAPGPGFASPEALKALKKHQVKLVCLDASGLARQAGAPKSANLVLLAAAAQAGALPLDLDALRRVVLESSPPARRQANQRLIALAAGQA